MGSYGYQQLGRDFIRDEPNVIMLNYAEALAFEFLKQCL